MSFFKNLFGGKKENAASQAPAGEAAIHADPAIRLHHVEHGKHGDHHGGLFGFSNLETEEGVNQVQELVAAATVYPAIAERQGVELREFSFASAEPSGSTQLGIRAVTMEEQMISGFPYLQATRALPFVTKDIFRWQNVNDLEADILGNGKDTFGIGFFATNWLDRQADFYQKQKIEVRLSAFLLVLREFVPEPPGEEGQPTIGEDFCGYFPNEGLPGKTYYDFIGIIRAVAPATLPGGSGYFLDLQLINQPDDPDFFVVEAFVNSLNLQMEGTPEIGQQVTGVAWFQGELV